MDALAWLETSQLSTWLRESETIWALPTVLTVHTIGLGLLVGTSWVVDLRLLGVARAIPLGPLRPCFVVMWIGFWMNALTGLLLFSADATGKGTSPTFLVKMLCVALGVVTIVLLKRTLDGQDADAAPVSGTTKLLALASLVAWTMALITGRLLAYRVAFEG